MISYNGNIISSNGIWMYALPSIGNGAIRCKFKYGYVPDQQDKYISMVHVSDNPNIWDLTPLIGQWSGLLKNNEYLLEVLDVNLQYSLSLSQIFANTPNLTYANLSKCSGNVELNDGFNESGIQYVVLNSNLGESNSVHLFENCYNLKDLNNIKFTGEPFGAETMFQGCVNVESGILDLYNRLVAIGKGPYGAMFRDCGINTETGRAELEQIPSDWK